MKILLSLIFCFYASSGLMADDGKYEKAMKKSISMIDSAHDVTSMIDVANRFERIADAEKDKWLPYYYTSFMYAITCFTDTVTEKKDGYLDKADYFIHIADSLVPNESENYVMMGMIAQGRLQIDPMNRYMKYGPISTKNFKKAMELDTLNPRPEYLMGISTYYTPEQFGGGLNRAKPILEKSFAKFNQFVPDNDLMPNWGRQAVEGLLNNIKEQLEAKEEN